MRAYPRDDVVAFLQRTNRGRGRGGRGGRGGTVGRGGANSATGAATNNTIREDVETRTNSPGESHCYNRGSTDGHWPHEYPDLDTEQ